MVRIRALKEIIAEFANDNPKLNALLTQVVDEIEKDKENMLRNGIWILKMLSMKHIISGMVNLKMKTN